MASEGVSVVVQDGNLGLQPGSNQNTILVMGCALGTFTTGLVNTQSSFGDPVTAINALVGGEGLEKVIYNLKASPGCTVLFMPLNPSTQGGAGTPVHTGSGAMTLTPSLAPPAAITIACTTPGALGTAAFTFQVGSNVSAPVLSASGWSSTGYLIPGTYLTAVFTAGSYVATSTQDTYTISTLGVVAHATGSGPAVPTFTTSPIDFYRVLVTITKAGAVGTAQFTYSLDNGQSTSAVITTAASYAIPSTGVVLGFSGTSAATDTYTFNTAGPTFSGTDLTAGLTAIETTLLSSQTESLIEIVGSVASAAAWATQVASLESAAVTLAGSNIYVRFFAGGPTLGTVLQNAGSVTVDVSDTDSTVISARAGMSAPHVCVAAADGYMVSPFTGVQFRRNASWAAAARAVGNPASQDIGAVEDGGLSLFTSVARDDAANGLSFYNAGITSFRTYGPGPVFLNRGLMGTVSTSDYYPLTNGRVIDRASAVGAANLKPYVLKKLPTQTRNGQVGTIREDAALKIESKITGALNAALVQSSPQDAVAAKATVTRTNNIFSTQQLIVTGAVQPFGYPTAVIFNVGMTVQL